MSKIYYTLLFCCLAQALTAQLYRDDINVIMDFQFIGDIQFADLDLDGDLDLVTSKPGYNGSFLTYFNLDGQGNYGPPIPFGDTSWIDLPNLNYDFDLGDMDNDGDLDLVAAQIGEGAIPYYINDGNGQFSLPNITYNSTDNVQSYHDLEVADLDGDGAQDVVIYRPSGRALSMNRNLGNGQDFEEILVHEGEIPLGNPGVDNFFLFDYDQDGDLDYGVTATYYDGDPDAFKELHLHIYEQTCNLCFEESYHELIDSAPYFFSNIAIETADMNNDGFPDIIFHYETEENLPNDDQHVLKILSDENGGSSFTTAYQREDAYIVKSVDFDGDNDLDLFARIDTNPFSNQGSFDQDHWLENTGNFSFVDHLVDTEYGGNIVMAADLNTDGIPDFITRTVRNGGTVGVRLAQSDLSFEPFRSLDNPISRVLKTSIEDWNADGAEDILFFATAPGSGNIKDGIYRATNLGNGQFSRVERVYEPATSSSYLFFGDINMDGTTDAIGMEGLIGLIIERRLFYTLQQADGTWSEGSVIADDLPVTVIENYTVTDWENDGDPDIIVQGNEGEFYLLTNTLNEGGSFSAMLLDIEITHINGYRYELVANDFNQDGIADLFVRNSGDYLFASAISNEPEYTAWDTLEKPEDVQLISFHIADFTADGYDDVLSIARKNGSQYFLVLAEFQLESNSFSPMRLVANDIWGNSIYYSFVDLNNDGAMDVISGSGFHINQENGTFFTSGYIPPPLDDVYEQAFSINAILSDIDGDGETELVSGSYELLSYDYGFIKRSTVNGFVRWDTTAQCQVDSIFPALANWQVSVIGSQQEQVALTNNDGRYGSILAELDEQLISVVPPSGYWAVCPSDTLLNVVDSTSTFRVDFAAEALVDCPLVVIDMNSTVVSQCFNSTVSIGYNNVGTAPGDEVIIELQFDPRFTPINSTPAWTDQTDTTLILELGTVGIGEFGHWSIHFEPDCEGLDLGEEVCFIANITPNDLCEEMLTNWDGANLEAEVLCEEGELSYRIINTGEGATGEPVNYMVSIVNDDIILYLNGDVTLEPGEADTIPLPAGEESWHLRLGQTSGHPYPVPVSLIAHTCGENTSNAMTNLLPNGNGNPFSIVLCREVVGPYDPNDKTAVPIGLGTAHYIERNWPIDYTIQFQNVGTARARTVILRDQLSEHLDLSSFEPGPASHDFEWRILENRQLMITFTDINLIDSLNDPAASQGFFSFQIQAKSDAAFESVIENYADIYFDFNLPIRTATVQHRLRKPVRGGASQLSLCPGENYLGLIIEQDTVLEERFVFSQYDSVHWHHLQVYPENQTTIDVVLEEAGWWEGTFISQDTLLTEMYTDVMGCDSTVLYHLQLLTSSEDLALARAVQLQPNPAQSRSLLQWSDLPAPQSIRLYNPLGQLVRQIEPSRASTSYHLELNELAAGSYQLVLWWDNGKQLKKKLQVM